MRRIQFADFEINLDLFTLSKNGVRIPIGPKPLDLLVYLIENRDRVVSRETLQQGVWKAKSLSAATIPTTIMEIRKALGDEPSQPIYIASVRGRGYRFITDISMLFDQRKIVREGAQELPFAGRKEESRALARYQSEVSRSKSGKAVLISGEAGIGKTRILQEFAAQAQKNIKVVSVKSPRIEGSPPFWLWTSLIRLALSSSPSNSKLAKNADELAANFPEISNDVPPPTHTRSQLSRFSAITQWIKTIKSIPDGETTLITLEDIHRADSDSLTLLSCLVEELESAPILLVATHRPPVANDQRRERISEVASFSTTKRVALHPLTTEEISSMLDPLEENREKTSRSLWERTSGNAFYVTHLIRHIGDLASLESADGLLEQLPLSGREIVSRQLSDLPRETRSALAIASTIGDHFSIQILASVTKSSSEEIISTLSPAKRAGIVTEDTAGYSFAHSLLREALYFTLDPLECKRLHLLVAQDLIERPEALGRAAEASHHLLSALPLSDPAEARRYATRAGRDAASRFALSESAIFFARAYEIEQMNPRSNLEDLCGVMQELALAKLYTNDRLGARELLLRAADLARQLNSTPLLASCALTLAPDFLTIEVGVHDVELLDLLRESLRSLPPGDTPLRAQLLARLSQAGHWTELPSTTESLAERSLQCARVSGDKEALIASLAARAESLHGPAFAHARLDYIAELGALAREQRDISATLLQHTRSITAHLELGNIRQVEILNERYRTIASETKLPQFQWYPKATDAMLAMMHGDIDEAAKLSDQFLAKAGDHKDQNLLQTFACHSVLRAIERDRSVDAIPLVSAFAAEQKQMHVWSAALPWLHWDAGQYDEARRCLNQISSEDITNMSREPGGGVGLGLLSEVSVALAYEAHTRVLYDIVSPIFDRCSTVGYGVAYLGSFSRYAGLLARSLGKKDEADDLLKRGYNYEKSRGAPSWQAYCLAEIQSTECIENILHLDIPSLAATLTEKNLSRAFRLLTEAGLVAPQSHTQTSDEARPSR